MQEQHPFTQLDPSPQQASLIIGVTVKTINRWVKQGRLESYWIGGRRRITTASIEAMKPPVEPVEG